MEGHFHQSVTRSFDRQRDPGFALRGQQPHRRPSRRPVLREPPARIKRDAGAGFDAAHRADARLVEMIAAGDGREVEQLWRRHLEEALVSLRPLGRMTVLELTS